MRIQNRSTATIGPSEIAHSHGRMRRCRTTAWSPCGQFRSGSLISSSHLRNADPKQVNRNNRAERDRTLTRPYEAMPDDGVVALRTIPEYSITIATMPKTGGGEI